MNMQTTFYRRCGKRLLDLALTIPAVVLLAPVLMLVAVLVRWRLGSPVLFRQQRGGWHGQPFDVIKFRTMTERRDAAGNLRPDDERLTRLGRFLRGSSLDELAQVFNVLKGEMSLVGPRPFIFRYMPYYSETERKRFDVLPGLTGWAQINGRDKLSWDGRLAHDVWYVENCSLWLDLKILCLTVAKLLRRDRGHAITTDLDVERRERASWGVKAKVGT
jgi:lipopolysaccharide/colanic/teichoic acid biosynthesis glycosyltransferase